MVKPERKGITKYCRECGQPYTDRIDPRVNELKGGYVVCPKCAMGLSQHKEGGEGEPQEGK